MKTLILMRHGKSSWKLPALPDHDRPLKKRGRTAAATMARWLAAQAIAPDIVLCSSARRTRQTLEIMRDSAPGLPEPRVSPALYEAAAPALLAELRRLPGSCGTVLLLGHQPGLGELLGLLTRRVRRPEDNRALEKLPTAAVAVLEADVARWPELGPARAELVAFAAPREVATDPAGSS